jgi:hypothetical protein
MGKKNPEPLPDGNNSYEASPAEDIAALEDALEFSSLGPDRRASVLADIEGLMASKASTASKNASVEDAAEITSSWLQLPEVKAGQPKLTPFRHSLL